MTGHDIIVIGTSSGGVDALRRLVAALPRDLAAAVFVVLHRPPNNPSLLAEILRSISQIEVEDAADGAPIAPGHVYVAPPDWHLLLEHERIRLTRGPKENRFRPAIDPLFRSAAYSYGPRAIGVVMTGNLDDGTAGLWSIKDRGGVAIVQDPNEAAFPSMPSSALANVEVDHCLPLDQIAPTLVTLSSQAVAEGAAVPEKLRIETRIALEDNALESGVMKLGTLSPFTCPECKGILLQIDESGIVRFRCHTGHAYSIASLLDEVTEAVEQNMWSSVRAMDELVLLLRHIEQHARVQNSAGDAARLAKQSLAIQQRTQLIRQALMQEDPPSAEHRAA
jgi:two-component system chemotaxis response regulator CheB